MFHVLVPESIEEMMYKMGILPWVKSKIPLMSICLLLGGFTVSAHTGYWMANCQVHLHEADLAEGAMLAVGDIKGPIVYTHKLIMAGDQNVQINTKNCTAGLYLYHLSLGGRRLQTLKLSVVH